MTDVGVGGDVSVQLERARRSLESLAYENRVLADLPRLPEVLSELDPDRLVQRVGALACDAADARFAMFVSGDEAGDRTVFRGPEPAGFASAPVVGRAPLLAAVLLDGQSLRIDDVSQWATTEASSRAYGTLARGELIRSWVAAAVLDRDGIQLGVLYLGQAAAGGFTPAHETVVSVLAALLGGALHAARVISERTEVATALQSSLLPPLLPEIRGIDVAARYRATGAGNLVGGDFYDVFDLGAGQWGVLLGDVSGFGAEAAALTGIARYTMRAIAAHNRAPSTLLTQLHETMLRLGPEDRFCTAIYAVIDLDHGGDAGAGGATVTLASGGHPPAIVLRDDGGVEVLGSTGTLLGLLTTVELTDQVIALAPGDAIVLYTDGVIEARDAKGDQFGIERLADHIATCAGRSADGIARRIELTILDHQPGANQDDLAVLVLRLVALIRKRLRHGSASASNRV